MGQSLTDYTKLSDREIMILLVERQEKSDERLDGISECLDGTNEILDQIKLEFTTAKADTKAVDTKADGIKSDVMRLEKEVASLRKVVLFWNTFLSLVGGAIAVMFGFRP